MKGEEARKMLHNIFGIQLIFNKTFNDYAEKLKEGMMQELIEWCKRCKDNKELGSTPLKKEHKNLYVFFRKIGSNVRAILIKEQNSNFIQLTLENHEYYDDTRMKLGYKKSSYYGS